MKEASSSFCFGAGVFPPLLSPNDSRSAVLSNSEMGVVFIIPVIILSLACWVCTESENAVKQSCVWCLQNSTHYVKLSDIFTIQLRIQNSM